MPASVPAAQLTKTPAIAVPNKAKAHSLRPAPVRRTNMPRSVSETIAAIETMDLEQVRATWHRHFGCPPGLRSVDLMQLVLAWRLQAKLHGGIGRGTRRKLKRKAAIEAEGLDLGAGTQLTREWQGQTYTIMVEEAGFRWDGVLFPSLSAVATAITGTRWNGPKFFGLRDKS